MAPHRTQGVLREALEGEPDLALALSKLLVIFFEERLQPQDPRYISEAACRDLLREHSDVKLLLESAIREQDYELLWNCGLLQFKDAELRSERPQTLSDYAIDFHIDKFVATYRDAFKAYAQNPKEFSHWIPDDTYHEEGLIPPAYKDFIMSLRLPLDGDDRPSLLPHELGKHPSTSLLTRLKNIFQPKQHTLFTNAAATGKTRLLFEGLSTRWGLYITCSINDTRLGSADMDTEICTSEFFRQQRHTSDSGTSHAEIAARNVQVARQLSERILLARLTAFNLYLDSIPDLRDEQCRQRWLLLQLLPQVPMGHDIFFALRRSLRLPRISSEYVRHQIADTLLKIRSKLGRDEPIFCVLDDAQLASRHYAGEFGQSSALREIARVWEEFEGLTVVLAGTPFNMVPFGLPDAEKYQLCTDTGSFDDYDAHATYVRRYLPPDVVASESGDKLVHRICLWLRGRYGITSMFIDCMLATRFLSPHTLLSAYLAKYARVEPEDRPVQMNNITRHDYGRLIYGLGRYDAHAKLVQDHQAWVTMQMVVQRMVTLRHESVKITQDCFRLVTLGFAIFSNTDGTEVTVDEPIHVFSAVDALFRQSQPALGLLCTQAVSRLETWPTSSFFHLALVPLMMVAMKSSPRLCDLFMFAEPRPPWATQTFRLVCMTRESDAKRVVSHATPYVTSFPARGFHDSWATESPEWLNHTVSEPFCVASGFSNAELLWTVQLEDSTLVHVAFKAMLKNEHVDVSNEQVEEIIARLAPERIFQVPAPPEAGAQSQFFDLPTPVTDANSPPIIRVFATYPAVTDVSVLRRDASPQPRAALNWNVVEGMSSDDLPVQSIIQRVFCASIIPRRRRLVGDGPGLRVAAEN